MGQRIDFARVHHPRKPHLIAADKPLTNLSVSDDLASNTSKTAPSVSNSKPQTISKPALQKPSTKSHKKLNLKLLLLCLTALLAITGLIILIIFLIRQSQSPVLDDAFFTSDDTKTVISLSADRPAGDTASSINTRFVYTFDGDTVTGLKTYFEYRDEETAANALATLKDQPEFKNSTLEGKFIVVTAEEDQYKGLTVSDVRQQADAIQEYQASQKKTEEKESNNASDSGPEKE